MCRSIKPLRGSEGIAGPDEVDAAALQFVRKISGMRKPSQVNVEAFDQAVAKISEASQELLSTLKVRSPQTAAPS